MPKTNNSFVCMIALLTTLLSQVSCSSLEEVQTSPIKPFTFVQMCDTQLGFGGYEHDVASFKQAVKQINALKPDFTVICGDLVNKADDQSFADFNAIRETFAIPCYCASGNHDVSNQPTPATLKNYREKIGRDYYAVQHNGYTFIITNTQLWKAPLAGESEKHHNWVIAQLKKAKAKNSPVFIVGHYPLFVKTPQEEDGYYNIPLAKRNELLTLYKTHGVIAVVAGHTHKFITNEYDGIQFVNGETTSKNFDKRPFGFRLWTVKSPTAFTHEFIPLQ